MRVRHCLYGEEEPSSIGRRVDGPEVVSFNPHWLNDQGLPTLLHEKLMRLFEKDEIHYVGVRQGLDYIYYPFEIVRKAGTAFRATFDLSKNRRIVMVPGQIEIVSTKDGRLKERFLCIREDFVSSPVWIKSAEVREVDIMPFDQFPHLQCRANEYLATVIHEVKKSLEIQESTAELSLLSMFGPPPPPDMKTSSATVRTIDFLRRFVDKVEHCDDILLKPVSERYRIARVAGIIAYVIRRGEETGSYVKFVEPVVKDYNSLRPAIIDFEQVLGKSIPEYLEEINILRALRPEAAEYLVKLNQRVNHVH